MLQILQNIPVWVWPLFVTLVIVGLRATRDRQVPVVLLYLLPLLGVLGLRSIAALPAPPWIWLVALAFYACGVYLGVLVQRPLTGARHGRMISVAGETWTLGSMMLIFFANFVAGFALAIAPDLYASIAFQVAFTSAVAVVAGVFAGRSLQVWQS